ncbi:MAG: hypothetical protein A2Y75_12250 [Candidatus Solincola sediminis]|uniref:Dinitrogenase iron-molybdenum cofactor biosynthesis domain-containing protein n=1 Tax=Candidatus Solincola sediminis TaxID=1797199 RepID=A0A1F2WMA0_9ACTN|nr:MAG: hypothetical protein A2Y75_12250 [Candidatus Solincola sediminis]
MIIAVVMEGDSVSSHFGRCEKYMLAKVEDGLIESSSIEAAPGHECGALAGIFARHGVETVIVGGIGAGAISHLRSAGINVVSGASGRAAQVLSDFIGGSLESQGAVCQGEHGAHGECHHGSEHH